MAKYLDGIQAVTGHYQDLGEIINFSGSLAVNGIAYSQWFDDMQWVRAIILLHASDQPYDVQITRRDTAKKEDWGTVLVGGQGAVTGFTSSNSPQRPSILPDSTSAGSSSPLTGYSFRIGIINKGTAPLTATKVRMQVFGE